MTTCQKKAFDGPSSAKRAHRNAGYRIRPYQCEKCGKWHVTAQEKRHHQERPE